MKLILGFVWTLIRHFQIRSTGRGLSTKQAMKEWLNTLVPEYAIQNFTTNWNDGRALCGLVDRLKPGLCPNHMSMNPKQGLENCRLGMELAQNHFGIPAILDPEDLHNPDVDDLSVMTYLSYFFEPALRQLLAWIQQKIPAQKVTNLSTDWNTGVNLAALMEACHKGLIPDWKSLDPHNSLDNMQKCIDVAKHRLNIDCPVKASVLTDPKVDEIVMATYLSRFKYSKLLAQPDKLSIILPHIPNGVVLVNEPFEFWLDLGQDPMSVINDLEITATGPTAEAEVDLSTGEKTTATFVPTEEGDYQVSCKLNGEEIQGSPFTLPVVDPKNWQIAVNPPRFLQVRKLFRLPVKGNGTRAKIECSVTDLSGVPVSFITSSIDASSQDGYNVILDPSSIGKAKISIKIANSDVQKSPFNVTVCDVTRCSVSGLGSGKGRVGEPLSFTISTSGAGEDRPEVTAKGPSAHYTPELKEEEEGLYKATFTPLEPGDHAIKVLFSGEPIPGSPFQKYVENLPDSGSCSATGPGLTEAIAKIPATFSIITPEKNLLEKPDALLVEVTSGSAKASVTIDDKGNGTYLVTYTAPKEGKYTITALFFGNPIPGSPFEPKVLPPADASKCRAYGPALHPNALLIAGRPLDFFVDTKKAGTGQLQVEAQAPNKTNTKVYIAEDDRIYSLKFDPSMAGWYKAYVWWERDQIPGSPFKLRIHPGPDASKVKAYGPGLGPTIEVGKTSQFTIETRNAGIGTLSVVVHGIKDAFKVEVNPIHESDPRTLFGEYNPSEGGEYSVTIKWSGKEIPNSPFPVRVVDLEYEKQLAAEQERQLIEMEEFAKRKARNEMWKKQRQAWLQAQARAQAGYQSGGYAPSYQGIPQFKGMKPNTSMSSLMGAPTGGMMTTKHVKRVQRFQKTAASTSALTSGITGSVRTRKISAPVLPTKKFSSAAVREKKRSLTVEAAMQNNAEAMISRQMEEAYGLPPSSSSSSRPTSPPPTAVSPHHMGGPTPFSGGNIPDELPVPYAPVYVATGEMPEEREVKKQVKVKTKKKWRF